MNIRAVLIYDITHPYGFIFINIQMAWFKYTIEQVAIMSGCDRCTVIHSISECKNLMETDRIYREKCNQVIEKLNNNQIVLP